MPSIYDAIKADHDRHRALLETIGDTTQDIDSRRTAWEEFFYEVHSHAAAEEETFYSKLMTRTWGQDAARHSVAEHKELDDMMAELHDKDISSWFWMGKFKKLRHDYEHHIDEEEADIFTRAKEVIPDSETEGYGARFLARKAEERALVDAKADDKLED